MSSKLSVWSPRPNADKIRHLSNNITIYGLPIINISSVKLNDVEKQKLLSSEYILFVSQYGVKYLLKQISRRKLNNKYIIAIGKKTADTLKNSNIYVNHIASAPYSSESLLYDSNIKSISYSSISIISGIGGRELLKSTFIENNNNVRDFNCYRRDKNSLSNQTMLEFIKNNSVNAIILTSCEIVTATVEQLKKTGLKEFWNWPVFVFSTRIASHAKNIGFSQIIVSDGANSDLMDKKIKLWSRNKLYF